MGLIFQEQHITNSMLEIQVTLSSWSSLVSPISTHQKTMWVFHGLPQFGNSKVWGNSDRCQPLLASSILSILYFFLLLVQWKYVYWRGQEVEADCCVAWFLGTIFGPPQKDPRCLPRTSPRYAFARRVAYHSPTRRDSAGPPVGPGVVGRWEGRDSKDGN